MIHPEVQLSKTRFPTIGFLTANIHIGAAQPLWRGVLDAASAGDANLIGFPGGAMGGFRKF